MKKAFFVLLLFIRTALFAQPESPGGLPQLLPATPEAAKLVNVGLGNINKSSGAVQVALPLYELNVGGVKLPITLNYQSQGNKVEELCSRTGFGWSLNAGGVITRSVMGMPDEKATRAPIPANLLNNTQEVLDYLENGKVANSSLVGVYDTQPDEFYYSFNGHSGKFILNDVGTPEIITHENLQITVSKSGNDISIITIITPDGVTYVFGDDAFERTQSDGFYKGGVIPKTSFLLRRILLITGDNIQFTYIPIQTRSHTGFSESVNTPGHSEHDGPFCPAGHFIESRSYSFQDVTYNACYLSSIQTSTNIQVSFTYEPMPDNSGDVRLQSFDVTNQNLRMVCKYFFNYLNYNGVINDYHNTLTTISPGINGRFYLTKLYQQHYKGDGVAPEILAYDFDYYGDVTKGFQPVGTAYSQDHFGFANGEKNNQSLIPQPAYPDDFQTSVPWGDRGPDWNFAVQGVLKKITYPTNGTEEFFYEPNTIMRMETVPMPATFFIDVQGSGNSSYGAINGTKVDFFNVYKDQDVTVNYTDFVGSQTCPAPCGGCKPFYCTITDATTGDPLQNFTMLGLTPQNFTLHLIANHVYRVQVDVTGPSCFHGSVNINYDLSQPGPIPVNKITGGVRVNKIIKTDPVTGNANNTFFYYAALSSLSVSSGVGFTENVYRSDSRTGSCDVFCSECGHNTYTSNGIYNLFSLDHSHVYYTSIIEADDAAFTNGGIEYTYYSPSYGERGIKIRGTLIPFAPDGQTPDLNGVLHQTKVFDNTKQPKTIEEDNYETVSSDNIVRSIYIRKNYTSEAVTSPPDETPFWPFDIRELNYAPRWVRLTSKRKTEYSDPQHSLETLTTFAYGPKQNVLPVSITTTNSKGQDIRTERKYPTDYTNDPVMTALQQNYNIVPVIEEYKYRASDNKELESTKNIYKDWFNDGKVIEPMIAQHKKTGIANATLEDHVVFAGYDTKANITEISKKQGFPITYFWDHRQSLVTGEIKNAHPDQVAYTSFEGDNKGGWNYIDQSLQVAWVPTGTKSYNLPLGAITRSGLNPGITYIVSYWSNDGAYNANNTTPVKGRRVKGWDYFQHIITGATDVIVSGTGWIDELRLYPQGALMNTITYEPLVGITSRCDADNRIDYYEYDDVNRLVRIRDLDWNIQKQFDYEYKVEFSFTAQWQATGATRCLPCSQNANYPNGYQEHEEKDVNVNSPTYSQTRWINDGATSACAIQADWQRTGVIMCEWDGKGENTGYVFYEEKDMNPCSGTYGNTRLMLDDNRNCSVCPLKTNWQQTGNVTCERDANNQLTGYKNIEFKDMEPCSPTGGATVWHLFYDPTGPCYVCTTGNCSGRNKCINGVCEPGHAGVYSSVWEKVNGVFKWKTTYVYFYSDCTSGAVAYIEYYDTQRTLDACMF